MRLLEKPLVSIILPCYNCEKYIEQAVNSILTQTYSNIEVLITDDCSTDNSLKIVEAIAKQDSRVIIVRHTKNQGIVRTLNELIEYAKGTYVARMDADDISLPSRIEKQVAFLENNPQIAVCGTNYVFINENNRKLKESDLPCSSEQNEFFLKYYSTICHPTAMVRASVYVKNRYKEEFIYAEDYELWCRLVFRDGLKIANLPEVLFQYRMSENQICNKNHKKQFINTAKIYEENHMIKSSVLDTHKELFYLMENEKLTESIDSYIKHTLIELEKYEYKYSYLITERIFYYLRRRKQFGKVFKLVVSPIGFDMIFKKLRWIYNSRIKRG